MEDDETREIGLCCFCGQKLTGSALRFYLSEQLAITNDDEPVLLAALRAALPLHGGSMARPGAGDWVGWTALAVQHDHEGGCCEEIASIYEEDHEIWPMEWDEVLKYGEGPPPGLLKVIESLTPKERDWLNGVLQRNREGSPP